MHYRIIKRGNGFLRKLIGLIALVKQGEYRGGGSTRSPSSKIYLIDRVTSAARSRVPGNEIKRAIITCVKAHRGGPESDTHEAVLVVIIQPLSGEKIEGNKKTARNEIFAL